MPPPHAAVDGDRPVSNGLVPAIRRIAESPEMLAVQWALPPSFAGLFIGLVWFIAAAPGGSLLAAFNRTFAAAFGVMAASLVVLLAYDLSRRRGVPPALGVALSALAFGLSLPYAKATSLLAFAKALGPTGLFLAIGIALVAVDALAVARARLGPRPGSIVAAVLVSGVAAALLALGISLTDAIGAVIAPLGDLGDSLTALLVITLVETLLWTVGIHGPALLAAVVLPVYVNLQLQNTEALARGEPLPHIVTVSIFLFVFPGGAGAAFPLVLLLLRSRITRVRNVALAALLPSLANANEPLMFGLPVVLNPALGIPFVVTPLVLATVTWWAMNLGLVAKPAYYIPSTIPLPFGVFLATRDWRSVVLLVLNVAIGLAIYAPFVRAYERNELERERLTETAA